MVAGACHEDIRASRRIHYDGIGVLAHHKRIRIGSKRRQAARLIGVEFAANQGRPGIGQEGAPHIGHDGELVLREGRPLER